MADSLIDLPGSGLTPTVINPPRIRYPFRLNPVNPDNYSRITDRDFWLAANYYETNRRIAVRTTYANLLSSPNDFASGAWAKINSGAGSLAPVVTAGFTGPDSQLSASRIVMDRGAAGGNFDSISQVPGSLSNPHATGAAIWLKSNTGASQVIGLQLGQTGGPVAATITTTWQRFNRTASADASGAINMALYSIGGGIAGDQVVDILAAYAQADSVASIGPYGRTGTFSVPDFDSIVNSALSSDNQLDPFAFLVGETEPLQGNALIASFTRIYSRLPAAQIIPSTKFFTRPVLDDVFVSATAWAVSFDPFQKYSWVFTARKSITSIGALVLGTTPIAQSYSSLPATTVTFTDSGAHSVAVFFNSGASSIQSSLAAALTSLGAITVTSTGSGLQIAWANGAGTMKSIESTSTAVTMGGGISALTVTFEPSQTNTQAPNPNPATRGVVCTGHGGHVGDYVVFWYNDRIIARSKVLIVTDADHFSVMGNDINGADIAPNYCGFSANAAACYVNGSKVCTTRKTTTFYLPGYSVGITTYADIPTQLTYLDSLSWLGRILAVPTGWANIEVSEVTQWMGAILQQEITEIQMDDALDTVTP